MPYSAGSSCTDAGYCNGLGTCVGAVVGMGVFVGTGKSLKHVFAGVAAAQVPTPIMSSLPVLVTAQY